ncbi:extensin [Iris pallida]|uniref:Extensin n=1 Tax=Iris pallida TaxID=29817 RepID=A0AAX6EUZ4_IRIPA|nr:extensin [Iris pallida]KAJ6829989.1 extensin [Iris pallida]
MPLPSATMAASITASQRPSPTPRRPPNSES